MNVALIIAGFLLPSAFSLPASEETHHVGGEKVHGEVAAKIHQQGVKEIQVEERINIKKTEILRPTVKCAEIVPDVGEAGPENHEACLAHCVQLEREYKHGKCLKGVCHCGIEREEIEKLHQQKEKGHPTVRCEHIIPTTGVASPVNHEACRVHCSSLSHEFTRGECFEGICHCGIVEASPIPVAGKVQPHTEATFKHPTVKCEHLVPLKGVPSAESHELCLIHCRSLGSEYEHGECVQGLCHCQRQQNSREEPVEGHPTVRCEHIHPLTGHPGPENHEACSSHCHTIAELYLEGKCVAGICRCQPGTVVKAVAPETHSSGLKCAELQAPGVLPHQACLAHCHTLDKKYREGVCHQGICHCQL